MSKVDFPIISMFINYACRLIGNSLFMNDRFFSGCHNQCVVSVTASVVYATNLSGIYHLNAGFRAYLLIIWILFCHTLVCQCSLTID